jgi:hypothetical protein
VSGFAHFYLELARLGQARGPQFKSTADSPPRRGLQRGTTSRIPRSPVLAAPSQVEPATPLSAK